MTRSELLEVAYQFYPRDLHECSFGYHDTVERQRQRDAARRGAAEYPTWKAMIRRLGERWYPFMDHSVCLLAGWYTPAYSCQIWIPGEHTFYFHVSLLGPYYGIHRTGAPGEEPAALDIAKEIEATYRGYEPIPPELGNEVVSEVTVHGAGIGEATIYLALLSEVWGWGSPTPQPAAHRDRPAPVARKGGTGLVALPSIPGEREASEQPDDDQDREAGEQPDDSAKGGTGA